MDLFLFDRTHTSKPKQFLFNLNYPLTSVNFNDNTDKENFTSPLRKTFNQKTIESFYRNTSFVKNKILNISNVSEVSTPKLTNFFNTNSNPK